MECMLNSLGYRSAALCEKYATQHAIGILENGQC